VNIPLQRRRLFIALAVTAVSLIIAMAAVIGAFGFHKTWMIWVFAGAILAGFASHGWLMLGVARDRSAP